MGTDLSGQKVGEYEIIARVGIGGMGVVYEGRHPLIGKRVAVKVLLPAFSQQTELVGRFLAEARAVNEIRHRGIVDIFSFGELPDGAHYLVMEFLQGEPFDKLIERRGPLPLSEALLWTEEILDALDAAHSAGIIHRDIKPSNLFLVDTGRGRPYVKLLDFGIAKLGAIEGSTTPQTRASVIVGTPDYLAPEQARGKEISARSDLYALGVVLFEMVTGQRPFRGENPLQTMWMHIEDAPPRPSAINPALPPELDELVLWALQKKQEDRPASAAVMLEHLTALRSKLMAAAPGGPGRERLAPLHTPSPLSGRGLPRPATPAPSPPTEITQEAVFEQVAEAPLAASPAASSSKGPWALAIAALALIVIVLAVALTGSGPQDEAAVPSPPKAVVQPVPKPPVAPTPTAPEPPLQVPSPPPEAPVPPAPPPGDETQRVSRRTGRAITRALLEARLRKLEEKLSAQETQRGDRDEVLRQFIAQAKKEIEAATTERKQREAAALLDGIAAQLKP